MTFFGLHWPFWPLWSWIFLKQTLIFADKNLAQLTCFQQSDVKNNLKMRSGILNHSGGSANVCSKGQLISKCPFEILDFPKIPRKI